MRVRWVPPSDEYKRKHPEYFQRSDVPSRAKKAPAPVGKRWTDGMWTYEVKAWGVYPASGRKRWTTWYSKGGQSLPDERSQLVRRSFVEAERALEGYARRLGMREVPR